MNPRFRLFLYLAAGAAIGVAIGADIADESFGLASLVAMACGWLILRRVSPADPDAWMLAAVIFGYVVGNRGFAQLQPANLIPLLPAEAVLLVAVPALLVRMAVRKDSGICRDALNYSILLWIALGLIRLPIDLRNYGVLALRDFAMVYYAVFFFVAQAFASRPPNVRVLTGAITLGYVCLIPVVISILIWPDFLVDNLTWRGIPLIYHKSDLIATSLAAGFFWLWTRWEKDGRRVWLVLAAASLLLIGEMSSPRAAMAAVGVTTLLWLAKGRWRIAAAQAGLIAAAAVIGIGVLTFTGGDVKTSVPYSMYEHAVSIFDPYGTGTYINGDSGNPADNNRFRLVWWNDVIGETMADNPIFGLGFGTDLAARFAADYGLTTDETFAARSPHSMIVTTFGRMGFLGLAGWLAVSALTARTVWRLFAEGNPDAIGFCCIVTVTWISACVGVVLESPMAAVIFWTALGLAHARVGNPGPKAPEPGTGGKSGDWPVAKPAALDTESLLR